MSEQVPSLDQLRLWRLRVERYGGMQLTKPESLALFDEIGRLQREVDELKHDIERAVANHAADVSVPEPRVIQLEGECPSCRQWVVLRSDTDEADVVASKDQQMRAALLAIHAATGTDGLYANKPLFDTACEGLRGQEIPCSAQPPGDGER